MADNEKNEEKKKSSINIKLIAIIVSVMLVTTVIAIGAFLFFLSPGGLFGDSTVQEPVRAPGVLYDPGGEFRTNLADPGGRRYLITQISLELNMQKRDEKVISELDEQLPIVRDRILSVLSAKSVEEFQSHEGRERVKREILISLNRQFGADRFRNVYFVDLVYQ
ncbi:flagellar basal body-associated FliL family protein [Heliorestis convoluta]|uniref:Flagellar protein FliL n=1 Tax=Heliorestis convoluta TaxID=356322 RepID=A0A5Q2MZI3_9FIRM|nr:flagellar basal body-associated FliL family protein [Heliorestis convoluta]QGG48178.1 flagellar basal body-associated FliL family protein [Heliorestis convoluta]